MRRFTIDGRNVTSFENFVSACNVGFIRHVAAGVGVWNGNLDAFNDFLSWPEEQEYELEIIGAANCAEQLGHAAQAAWLRAHLLTCHPSNVLAMQAELERAEAGAGQTLFDVIREIAAANPQARLILR